MYKLTNIIFDELVKKAREIPKRIKSRSHNLYGVQNVPDTHNVFSVSKLRDGSAILLFVTVEVAERGLNNRITKFSRLTEYYTVDADSSPLVDTLIMSHGFQYSVSNVVRDDQSGLENHITFNNQTPL